MASCAISCWAAWRSRWAPAAALELAAALFGLYCTMETCVGFVPGVGRVAVEFAGQQRILLAAAAVWPPAL